MKRIITIAMLFLVGLTIENTFAKDLEFTFPTRRAFREWLSTSEAEASPPGTRVKTKYRSGVYTEIWIKDQLSYGRWVKHDPSTDDYTGIEPEEAHPENVALQD